MAIYAGETLIITNSMTLDGVALEEADVESVEIVIYDSTGAVVVEQAPMSWNGTDERFEYRWDTSPGGSTPMALDPGTYRAKIIVYGADGQENWEYVKIRLARNPVE
jgi:hypothetical protein